MRDLKNLDDVERDILLDLAVYGRRTRHYYKARDELYLVKRLKSRGFVEAIRMNSNYAYDLTDFGHWTVKHGFV